MSDIEHDNPSSSWEITSPSCTVRIDEPSDAEDVWTDEFTGVLMAAFWDNGRSELIPPGAEILIRRIA